MAYRNPDLPNDRPGIAEAKRALKLPKRAPTDDDRPPPRIVRTHVIEGQTTVFDFLDEDGRNRR
jgi:hypothetical protein